MLQPPGRSGLDVRAHRIDTLTIGARGHSADDEIERRGAAPLLVDKLSHRPGLRRRDGHFGGRSLVLLRDYSIPAHRSVHRLHFWPYADDPDRNSRRLNRLREHDHIVDRIVLPLETELLSFPQPGHDFEPFVE